MGLVGWTRGSVVVSYGIVGPNIVGTPRPRRIGVQWESHVPRAPNGARGVQRWNAFIGRCTWPLHTDSVGKPSCQRFHVTSYAWALCGPFRTHCSYFLALSSHCGGLLHAACRRDTSRSSSLRRRAWAAPHGPWWGWAFLYTCAPRSMPRPMALGGAGRFSTHALGALWPKICTPPKR